MAWFGGKLAIVQDDALFVAFVSTLLPGGEGAKRVVSAAALARGEGGVRLFDEGRGNKRHKFDLEACVVVPIDGIETLVALGSGSLLARERIVLVRAEGPVAVVDARALYASLRARPEFAGIELNIEGAAVVRDSLVLASRGNGVSSAEVSAVDAIGRLDLTSFVAFLRAGGQGAVPELNDVSRFDLGQVGGARLTFTDLAYDEPRERLLYVACAEASPDAVRDGPVSGVALGVLDDQPRYGLVVDENGALLTDKIEGFVPDAGREGRFLAVVDVDDPSRPAELLELTVESL